MVQNQCKCQRFAKYDQFVIISLSVFIVSLPINDTEPIQANSGYSILYINYNYKITTFCRYFSLICNSNLFADAELGQVCSEKEVFNLNGIYLVK